VTVALCPGSYDPPTNGHIDVIRRTAAIFDRVLVAVVSNPSKSPMFDADERIRLLADSLPDLTSVEYEAFSGLLVEFAGHRGVDVIVKGLRAGTDFDYELQMAQMNRSLTGIETLFLPANPEWSYVSSTLIREVARLGGTVDALVPSPVIEALEEKL
jgi:pantetheine-phosphate adenylyltransferase